MKKNDGFVYLVGAGCGEADLITVRGWNRLHQCDAVIYDSLISPDLLSGLPDHVQKIHMGKRKDHHSALQEEINEEMIRLAKEGKRVVRLKGGDPFVFGRGGEEAMALQAAGIGFEVVPGISSAIAVPELEGIPVSHRNISRSFHVITSHHADSEKGFSQQLAKYAQLDGTLVFLMGLSKLKEISGKLIQHGMNPRTPAAVISGSIGPRPMAVRGSLSDIYERSTESGLQAPAVIVVGETASCHFKTSTGLPLSGIHIGITGSRHMYSKIKSRLDLLGGNSIQGMELGIKEIPFVLPEEVLDGKTHWLVFTSTNGVNRFFRSILDAGIDLRKLGHCKFAVIGSGTSKTLSEYGICADLCPEVFTSEALGRELLASVQPEEDIFLFRAREGSRNLYTMLKDSFRVIDMALYYLEGISPTENVRRKIMQSIDYITFESGRGVELFIEEYGTIPEHATCVCIGPVCAEKLKKYERKPFLMAADISVDGIVECIVRDVTGKTGSVK